MRNSNVREDNQWVAVLLLLNLSKENHTICRALTIPGNAFSKFWFWSEYTVAELAWSVYNLIQFVNEHTVLTSNTTNQNFILWKLKCLLHPVQATSCYLSEFVYKRTYADGLLKQPHTDSHTHAHHHFSFKKILCVYVPFCQAILSHYLTSLHP